MHGAINRCTTNIFFKLVSVLRAVSVWNLQNNKRRPLSARAARSSTISVRTHLVARRIQFGQLMAPYWARAARKAAVSCSSRSSHRRMGSDAARSYTVSGRTPLVAPQSVRAAHGAILSSRSSQDSIDSRSYLQPATVEPKRTPYTSYSFGYAMRRG